jgi:hypothetical protein
MTADYSVGSIPMSAEVAKRMKKFFMSSSEC